MNILFITDGIGVPVQSGGEIRHLQCYRALLDCGTVDVFAFQELEEDPKDSESQQDHPFDGSRNRFFFPKRLLAMPKIDRDRYRSFFGRMILSFGSLFPYEYRTNIDRKVNEKLGQICHENAYDLIWISCTRIAVGLKNLPRDRVVLDGDDFDSVREYYLLKNSPWYGSKIFNYMNLAKLYLWEWMLPRMYGAVARCSEQDRSRIPHRNVCVVPNGAEMPRSSLKKSIASDPTVLFVGMLGYAPNTQGLTWFLENIWGQIHQVVPNARLDVVGKGATPAILKHHGHRGVTIHGFQDDLEPFYQAAWISVVPLLAGAGTRLKILESLAYQTPVVSTPIGGYGIDIGQDDGLLLAKSEQEFVEACLGLFRCPENLPLIGQRGEAKVRRCYSWEKIRLGIKQLVSQRGAQAKSSIR